MKEILVECRHALILLSIFSSHQPFNKHSVVPPIHQVVFSLLRKKSQTRKFCHHGASILGDSSEIFHGIYSSTFWRFSRSVELNWIGPRGTYLHGVSTLLLSS